MAGFPSICSRTFADRRGGFGLVSTVALGLSAGMLAGSLWVDTADAKTRDEWKSEYVHPEAISVPEDNPYSSDKEHLGRLLIFDPRLSGADVEMNRSTDSLVAELEAIPGYRSLFNIAFPNEGVSLENIGRAIATYERTVVSGVAQFDEWIAGDETAISESAKRGFDLFNGKANCVACHSSWNFTDGSFHDIGLEGDDPGRANIIEGVESFQHAFKTPTLRNVVERAPYMHDGTILDLPAVVRHYDTGGIKRPSLSDDMKPLGLSDQEQADLVAFMLTLSSPDEEVPLPRLPAFDQTMEGGLSRISPAAGRSGGSGSGSQCGGLRHRNACPQQ